MSLSPHPAFPCDAVSSLVVDVVRGPLGGFELIYSLSGEIDRLKIAEPKPSARVDALWKHTCFEAFFSRPGETTYWEYNFSPSTQWAAYHFSDYRTGMKVPEDVTAPTISVTRSAGELVQIVDHVNLPGDCQDGHLGVSAVIEETDGRLSYWALSHPSEKPDFHHRGGFVLDLTAMEFS